MLAVTGGKGGSGKTTTTLALAAALGRRRRSVLAVDADREMPDLHAMAGVECAPGLDAVADGRDPREVAHSVPDSPGVSVLPSGDSSRVSKRENGETNATDGGSSAVARASRFAAFDRLAGRADAVLLDCPAGVGPDAAAPLRAADAALVVTTPEPACLRDAAKTAAMARELGTPVAGAVISRVPDVAVKSSVTDRMADLLDCSMAVAVPDVGRRGTPLDADAVRAATDEIVSILRPKYL